MATAVTTTAAQRKGATTVDYEAQPNACTALLVSSSGGQTAASSVSSATTGGAYENAQTVVAVSTVSDMDPDKARLGRKLNFCEFMLYNSLLFGMCFAKVGGPPIFACPMAGCCCMNIPPNFDVRHRLWMFFFVLWFTFFLSIPVAYGQESAFWMFLLLACVAAPVTCILRCHLLRFSNWARQTCPCSATSIRAEEVILIVLYIGAVVFAALTATSEADFIQALDIFWKAWLLMIGLDLLNLAYKYLFCFLCCRCCIPRENVFRNFMHWRADADVPNNVADAASPVVVSGPYEVAVAASTTENVV